MPSLYENHKASNSSVLSSILSRLSPIQQKFVLDESRLKLARCPRRAGKSYADAALMLYTAEKYPGSPIGYFGLTRDSAREAIWETLKEYIKACSIECDINDREMRVDLPNRSSIRLYGADMENMKNRFRGRKFKLVIIDECAFYAAVDDLVASVLSATLMDLQGTMVMTSSPGLLPTGLFYNADQGDQKDMWSTYYWTLKDNPHFQQPSTNPKYKTLGDEELARICITLFGGDWENPAFKREYLGEWVFDERSLIYPIELKHIFKDLRHLRGSTDYAIGLNLSQHGQQGYVVLRFSEYERASQIVEAKKVKCRNLNQLAQLIEGLQATYDTDRIYCYLGDNSPEILSDFKQRYPLPIQASKYEKLPFYQTIIATDIDSSYIEISEMCSDLIAEFRSIVKDDAGNEIAKSTLLSDAFFAVYLNIYNSELKAVKEPETEDQRMERELIERAMDELQDWNALYGPY